MFIGGFRVLRLGIISSKVNKSVKFIKVCKEEVDNNLRYGNWTA
jgi:hypothetical protein